MTYDFREQINRILSLEDNWDGEGSLGNYDKLTIEKALRYIPKMEQLVQAEKNIRLDQPDLNPGDSRSIDIEWFVKGKYEVLLNVPVEDKPAAYYGDFFDGKPIKGELALDP